MGNFVNRGKSDDFGGSLPSIGFFFAPSQIRPAGSGKAPAMEATGEVIDLLDSDSDCECGEEPFEPAVVAALAEGRRLSSGGGGGKREPMI